MITRNILISAALLLGLGLILGTFTVSELSASPKPAGQVFDIDPVHSSILFRVKHLDVSYFYGRFNELSGSFMVDEEDPSKSFVKIEVPTASVDTNNENRDKHLKSQDFFSAKEFPTLRFKSTQVEKTGKTTYRVTGDLTYRGVTKSVTFDAGHTGTAEVSERFGLRSGFGAMLEIKRSDFGDKYGIEGNVLGDEVRLIISLEGSLSK
jgi:polyisoprenoid-binding protein YceI